MYTFRKKNAAPVPVVFEVSYEDASTAYLWLDDAVKAGDGRDLAVIARQRQDEGVLPTGTITRIKRVR